MNKKLKFSWGHIIAFVALIFIAYTTFVGMTYLEKGNFAIAGVWTALIVLSLLVLFMAVQQLKCCDEKFAKKIVIERILFFASPVLFVALMIPYAHTWKVQKNNDEIVEQFNEAINSSRSMFTDYENYANNRISGFGSSMEAAITYDSLRDKYMECGFSSGMEETQKENRMEALRLQLLPCDYDSLKAEANKWIDEANHGANVWNVFLLGNVKEISSAIENWHGQLAAFSTKHTLKSEEVLEGSIAPFDGNRESIQKAQNGLTGLSGIYTERGWPSLWGWLSGLLCYIMLLFPWLVQKRHTKNYYQLIGYQIWHEPEKQGRLHRKSRQPIDGETNKTIDTDIVDTGI